MSDTESAELRKRIGMLLKVVGRKGVCEGCGRDVWWIRTKNGKWAPYTEEGISHFADCPQASMFRRKG